jgi:anti-sigma B factor antagonist
MFTISRDESGNVLLAGRLDASQVESAAAILDNLTTSSVVDFKNLDYISSAGLGILLKTQKRLGATGQTLTLINMNKMIRDVFHIARFDLIFTIR